MGVVGDDVWFVSCVRCAREAGGREPNSFVLVMLDSFICGAAVLLLTG
jgi:hypothetical protein